MMPTVGTYREKSEYEEREEWEEECEDVDMGGLFGGDDDDYGGGGGGGCGGGGGSYVTVSRKINEV